MPDEDTWVFENFKPEHFVCKCEGLCDHGDEIDRDLVAGLQLIRDEIGEPLYVNSGVRCPEHNKNEGGMESSRHLFGLAADVWALGKIPEELAAIAEKQERFILGGVGLYNSFVHLDVRGRRARWDNRSS